MLFGYMKTIKQQNWYLRKIKLGWNVMMKKTDSYILQNEYFLSSETVKMSIQTYPKWH